MNRKLENFKTEEAVISSLLAKNSFLKVTQSLIFFNTTYKQDMMAVGNENKQNKVKCRWIYCNHIPILSLLGAIHCLHLFIIAKRFICLNKTKQLLTSSKLDI